MLIVQDPVNPVALANSYQSLTDARTLAAIYGYTLDADDDKAELSMINSFRAIELKEDKMCGERATTIQGTSYPRTGVYIRCQLQPSDSFPLELLLAQVIGAQYSGAGTDLSGGVDDGKAVASEQVDVISVSYFENGKTGSAVTIPEFDNTLKPLMCNNTSGVQFTTVRV